MQPEEFKQFHQRALASIAPPAETAAETAADAESEARIAAVYDLFVGAKVMRR